MADIPSTKWYALLMRIMPINRRAFVAWAAVALVTLGINWFRGSGVEPLPIPEPPIPDFPDGWHQPTEEDKQLALLSDNVYLFSDTQAALFGDDENTDALVYRFYAKLHGQVYPAQNQGQIGSCIGVGYSGAVAHALAGQAILKRGPPQDKVPLISSEVIYGGSRVDVNGGRVPFSGDGSVGAWAVKWLSTGGIVGRKVYGKYDLSAYSVERCREWGNKGVPADLKPECLKNLCKYALVKSAEEARKALQQGYPIAVCSNQGFSTQRDSEGFLRPQGQWAHCMFIAGYRGGERKGFLIVNSWGSDWVTGPKGSYADIPDGSFWADVATVNRMMKQEDSYAISGVGGFVREKIKPEEWIVERKRFAPFFALAY